MANINPQTALVLLYLLDAHAFSAHILRLQLARQRELLRRVYVWSDYADAFPADLKRDLAGAIDAADDALAVTEAAA